MFREIPVTKKFKGHKKLVADNAVQLPLKHCQKKKKKITAAIQISLHSKKMKLISRDIWDFCGIPKFLFIPLFLLAPH